MTTHWTGLNAFALTARQGRTPEPQKQIGTGQLSEGGPRSLRKAYPDRDRVSQDLSSAAQEIGTTKWWPVPIDLRGGEVWPSRQSDGVRLLLEPYCKRNERLRIAHSADVNRDIFNSAQKLGDGHLLIFFRNAASFVHRANSQCARRFLCSALILAGHEIIRFAQGR